MRRSTEIAKNSSTSSVERPITSTPNWAWVSSSSTVGEVNTPRPSRPKAFIRALSSNSPTRRGCSWCLLNQWSSCWRTEDMGPWISIGAPCRHLGNGPCSWLRRAGAQKKLMALVPRAWLKALTPIFLETGSSASTRSSRFRLSCATSSENLPSWQVMCTCSARPRAGSSRW